MRETISPYVLHKSIQNHKSSDKNNHLPAWRDFKIDFYRPLFTISFRPKIVFLDTDSILRVKAMYESVKQGVLNFFIGINSNFRIILVAPNLCRHPLYNFSKRCEKSSDPFLIRYGQSCMWMCNLNFKSWKSSNISSLTLQ